VLCRNGIVVFCLLALNQMRSSRNQQSNNPLSRIEEMKKENEEEKKSIR